MIVQGEELLKARGLVRRGDTILMLAGQSHTAGATNMLRVHTIVSEATAAAVALGAAAAARRPARPAPRTDRLPRPGRGPASGTVQEGIASWYGPGYDGKRTSSGERFDQDDLTAAHPTWAFGTRVRVTFLSTGKSCVVRINDRFRGHKGRIVDLSRGAARHIGLIGPGSGRVRLEVVG